MSYMSPDTDPFGIYSTMLCTSNACTSNEGEKKHSFEDLTNLHNKQRKVQTKLLDIEAEKKKGAIEYLTKKPPNMSMFMPKGIKFFVGQ